MSVTFGWRHVAGGAALSVNFPTSSFPGGLIQKTVPGVAASAVIPAKSVVPYCSVQLPGALVHR